MLSSSLTSNTTNTENAPPSSPPQLPDDSSAIPPTSPPTTEISHPPELPAGTLPPPLLASLTHIKTTLTTNFSTQPPHTIQRLAELVLRPKQYYTRLHTYLNALDRVVSVSSSSSNYPLPASDPLNPHLINGTGHLPYSADSHSDDSLGGALLTPIPWLVNGTSRPRPVASQTADMHVANGALVNGVVATEDEDTDMTMEEQLREEGGVTQGELLRQEQEASEPPAPVGSTASTAFTLVTSTASHSGDTVAAGLDDVEKDEAIKDVAAPAEGPSHIGMEDIGAQELQATSGQVLDIQSAVGRTPATASEADEVKAEMAAIGSSENPGEQDTEMADVQDSVAQESREAEMKSTANTEDGDTTME